MSQGTLKIEEEKNFTIVSFFDTVILDETNITTFAEELVSVIKSRQKINLVIDFANIEFLSSAVLGKLVKIRKIVKKQGGKLKLCGLRTNLMQIFKVTKLHKVFDIVADRKKATGGGGFGLFG
ncbi:STAS domain-containing protein [Candidatus Uabimicrobium amorphum]|uniref:Anti-sigma factor antagonist n=1 Tax=Uabimicrobium amorphum TaxID=2596890 RepID=A0A5S9F202_UABAM|nr:STAS domain-containing protein [Candidatus Uabimicrobium amorphum]BBM83106.1 anti-anti-sigma factor [Candidatus Uabimicrobium amorphum]